MPYIVHRALHFSNGGGVYDAVERATGRRVLLKEARPHAGLDEQGRDAVERLRREQWALEQLADAAYVPDLVGEHLGREHLFLARDFVEGESLLALVQRTHPHLPSPCPLPPEDYLDWAVAIGDRVAEALGDMHDRGIAFGDVHPNNVLVTDDSHVVFIDLETATPTAEEHPQRIGAPGFRAPSHLTGAAADRYSLACLRLSLLLPATIVLDWGASKALGLVDEVEQKFGPLPERLVAQLLNDLGVPDTRGMSPRPAALPPSAAVHASILAAASPGRDDRLYPGSPAQFRTPGGAVTPAHGASGVLWARSQAGLDNPSEHLAWLEARVPFARCGEGLYEGWGGLAMALNDLGLHDVAAIALDRSIDCTGGGDMSVTRGRAGTILAALAADLWSPGAADPGIRLAQEVARTDAWAHMLTRRGATAFGLLDGPAGMALALHRAGMAAQDDLLLAAAMRAARADVERLFVGPWSDPTTEAQPGPWQRPTLHRGSAGTALVLAELLAERDDPELRRALDLCTSQLGQWHHEQPGLFSGRAGALLALRALGRSPDASGAIDEQERLLGLYAVQEPSISGYLGDHGLKMSCDLGSGAAGILHVLDGGGLPFCFDRMEVAVGARPSI